jgi:hypothetical protein
MSEWVIHQCNRMLKYNIMFLTVNTWKMVYVEFVVMLMIYFHTKFNIPSSSGSLVIYSNPESKHSCLTASAFAGVRALRGRPGDFFFKVEPVARNDVTHRTIVFRIGILLRRLILKWVRKARVAITDSVFQKCLYNECTLCTRPLHVTNWNCILPLTQRSAPPPYTSPRHGVMVAWNPSIISDAPCIYCLRNLFSYQWQWFPYEWIRGSVQYCDIQSLLSWSAWLYTVHSVWYKLHTEKGGL